MHRSLRPLPALAAMLAACILTACTNDPAVGTYELDMTGLRANLQSHAEIVLNPASEKVDPVVDALVRTAARGSIDRAIATVQGTLTLSADGHADLHFKTKSRSIQANGAWSRHGDSIDLTLGERPKPSDTWDGDRIVLRGTDGRTLVFVKQETAGMAKP